MHVRGLAPAKRWCALSCLPVRLCPRTCTHACVGAGNLVLTRTGTCARACPPPPHPLHPTAPTAHDTVVVASVAFDAVERAAVTSTPSPPKPSAPTPQTHKPCMPQVASVAFDAVKRAAVSRPAGAFNVSSQRFRASADSPGGGGPATSPLRALGSVGPEATPGPGNYDPKIGGAPRPGAHAQKAPASIGRSSTCHLVQTGLNHLPCMLVCVKPLALNHLPCCMHVCVKPVA